MRRIWAFVLLGCALSTGGLRSASADSPEQPVREWRFEATLDGRPIGEHTFRVTDRGGEIEVDSRASFDVRFLGISVYSYEHRATERWRNGCLAALDSHTDDNGKVEVVRGALAADGFALTRGGAKTVLPACTMTFAYWNPAMRAQKSLLNPQTGEYLDVTIQPEAAAATEEKPDGSADAGRYVIRARDLEIVLWYRRPHDTWLALDSRTSRAGLLSYRLRGT